MNENYKNKLWYDDEEEDIDEEEDKNQKRLEFPPYEIDELDEEKILSDEYLDYLCTIKNGSDKLRLLAEIRQKAKKLKMVREFNAIYKIKEKELGEKQTAVATSNTITFPEMEDLEYISTHYKITDKGIILEEIPNQGDVLVCYHPILPLEKYTNVEDGKQKVKLGFYVDEKWHTITVDKFLISSNSSIVQLSDLGIAVTSENARFLVRYLSEIENLNPDKIPTRDSTSRLGWIKNDFFPYTDQYVYGGDNSSFQNILNSISQKGSYEDWKNEMRKLRSQSKTLKLMMDVSFASILVEKLNINPFIVHLWGKSGTGKTVALMICASIFGNPEMGNLLSSLNNTEVAFEARLNFLNNFPALFDEYQMAKNRYESFDDLIYKLTEGKGKDRSNVDVRFTSKYQVEQYYPSIWRRTNY